MSGAFSILHVSLDCMHVCVYVYTYLYVCIYMCVYIYIYIYINNSPSLSISISPTGAPLYAGYWKPSIYIYICVCVYIYKQLTLLVNIDLSHRSASVRRVLKPYSETLLFACKIGAQFLLEHVEVVQVSYPQTACVYACMYMYMYVSYACIYIRTNTYLYMCLLARFAHNFCSNMSKMYRSPTRRLHVCACMYMYVWTRTCQSFIVFHMHSLQVCVCVCVLACILH
jgi:hypothetical protein